VATDALGRDVIDFKEAGPRRDNRKVGVFYFVWQGFHGEKVNDITKILESYPADPLKSFQSQLGGQMVVSLVGRA
jgi:hypothetical protein